jgi:hypothetical protein
LREHESRDAGGLLYSVNEYFRLMSWSSEVKKYRLPGVVRSKSTGGKHDSREVGGLLYMNILDYCHGVVRSKGKWRNITPEVLEASLYMNILDHCRQVVRP